MHLLGELLPVWSVLPFVGMLLSIALLPQVAPHFWHPPRNQLLVALGWSAPVVAGLLYLRVTAPEAGATEALSHAAAEYVSFIGLLGSLFVIAGGILVKGDLPAKPWVNTAFLATGAVLANLIGTTGASMLLIRPVLRTNSERQNTWHLPVFFIFVVSNVGGVLTPIGDPPLFLGYLRGVPFGWTLTELWPYWLVVTGVLLLLFHAIDTVQYRRETAARRALDLELMQPLRVEGGVNLGLLLLVVLSVLLLTPEHGVDDLRQLHLREIALVALAGISLAITSRETRLGNAFSWGPILEVAALFCGVFITMIPATALLEVRGAELALSQPWQYFWATGVLSSFLDNAPTYVTFAAVACGTYGEVCPSANELGSLTTAAEPAAVLAAISLGAVFMGANTYIGNGPNFMVRAIAEQSGYKMPSFFGYAAIAALVLGPLWLLVSVAL